VRVLDLFAGIGGARPGEPQHEWEAPRLAPQRPQQTGRGASGRGRAPTEGCTQSGLGLAVDGPAAYVAGHIWAIMEAEVKGRAGSDDPPGQGVRHPVPAPRAKSRLTHSGSE